jgi:ectoine hydroxylase-related dioxygenase (phytanoyl-CoA dioxygenase family)
MLKLNQKQIDKFHDDGFLHLKNFLNAETIELFHKNLRCKLSIILKEKNINVNVDEYIDINTLIKHIVKIDRKILSYIYDGMKGLPMLFQISSSKEILYLSDLLQNGENPFLIDVNFRIDLPNEEKFAFDWHQDFWYTHTDPNSLVFWIPFTNINEKNGRLKVIPLTKTKGQIAKVEAEKNFLAYNAAYNLKDGLELDFNDYSDFDMDAGDVLIFKHSVFHKSGVNNSDYYPRFTLQIRYSDYDLPVFKFQNWRYGTISRDGSSYQNVQDSILKFINKKNENEK